MVEFAQCIKNCGLNEIKFKGSLYTWWNGKVEEECSFKRLDRVFGNMEFNQEFPQSEVEHLVREGSDHAPLHVMCKSLMEPVRKPFRFLNFLVKHHSYKGVMERVWETKVVGSPFHVFNMRS